MKSRRKYRAHLRSSPRPPRRGSKSSTTTRRTAAYRKVVLEHSAAPHVEDARDRLVGMGLPVPTPTPEQVAASEALENSRGQYTLSKRAVPCSSCTRRTPFPPLPSGRRRWKMPSPRWRPDDRQETSGDS